MGIAIAARYGHQGIDSFVGRSPTPLERAVFIECIVQLRLGEMPDFTGTGET